MEKTKECKLVSIEEIRKELKERKAKMPKYPDLTEEEQDILDSIKIGLEDIENGKKGYTIEEMIKILGIEEYFNDFRF